VLDGEIAVPDERGVTHIDALNWGDALAGPSSSLIAPSISSISTAICAPARLRTAKRCCATSSARPAARGSSPWSLYWQRCGAAATGSCQRARSPETDDQNTDDDQGPSIRIGSRSTKLYLRAMFGPRYCCRSAG